MNTEATIEKAMEDFRFAHNEMMRPQEDVVLLSACYSVKRAIRGFLSAYLSSVNIPVAPADQIETLMKKCADHNIKFSQFNINSLNCKCDDAVCSNQTYCMDMDKLKQCHILLTDLCDFVVPLTRKGQN